MRDRDQTPQWGKKSKNKEKKKKIGKISANAEASPEVIFFRRLRFFCLFTPMRSLVPSYVIGDTLKMLSCLTHILLSNNQSSAVAYFSRVAMSKVIEYSKKLNTNTASLVAII